MKAFLFIIFLVIVSCGSKEKNLIDLKSFTNQGEKIDLVEQKNLNNKDVNRIKNLKNSKHFVYKEWSQNNQNLSNLLYPTRTSINKKKKSFSRNVEKFIIYKKKIITINNKSNVAVLDLNFKKLKSRNIYKRKIYKNYEIDFKIIAYKDKIFIVDSLGSIHCLNINNLEILWKKNFGVPFKSNLKIQNDKLFLINSNSKIYSINTLNGNLNWSFETTSRDLKDNKSYQIAIFKNDLIFTNDNAEIYCIDIKKNSIKWSLIFKTANFQDTPLLFKSSPITVDRNGDIYVSTNYGFTYALDIKSGLIKWSLPIYSINRFSVTDKYILNTWNNRIFVINKLKGKLVFNKKLSKLNNTNRFFFRDLIVGSKNIYIFNENGFMISLNKNNLNDYSKSRIAKKFENLIISNNDLYINTKSSILKY